MDKTKWNHLKSEIKFLKGVGEHRAKLLNKLGIFTINDLMEFFPRDYINRRATTKISSLRYNENFSFVGEIISIEKRNLSNRKSQLNVVVSDGEDYLFLTWFRYGNWFIKQFETGKQIWVSGFVTEFKSNPQIVHPEIEILGEDEKHSFWHSRNVLPVYRLTDGISMNVIRNLIMKAFELYSREIEETLPEYITKKFGFDSRYSSIQKMHFTQHPQEVTKLKIRYAFEELFYTQMMLARSRKHHIQKKVGYNFILKKTYTSILKDFLSFDLTSAQKRVIREIFADMNTDSQMNRLLQGDVGSGKTIVTVFAMLLACENGYQAVLMVPTEILAEQHFRSINALLQNQPDIKIGMLKGGVSKAKKEMKEKIRQGKINIIIGTHALIQKDVIFPKAGLIVIDEQHRFGVEQRAELSRKNNYPDLLYLSATPIPRSLALTVYGDLEVSIIDEMPPGRKPIKTLWHNSEKSNIVYEQVLDQLKIGSQVYIVCPLIEESEKIDLLDAETLFQMLSSKIYTDYNVALLHGRMKIKEKDAIMEKFKTGKIDVLVSTTVIEVGIDVPNATVMIIQHAERFGLSQLHQLRGRVGRGVENSYCYLIVYPPISADGRERLNIMVETNDGFKIAEKDLEIRGPGDFFGTVQSGIPIMKHANLVRDQELLQQARAIAQNIIEQDFSLKSENNSILAKTYFDQFLEKEKLFDY